ncbi:augurin [Egretta garzetta]|uniref:augurin n=1 Tax=Egretta garzetta TaxID=188379 RepID=UPI00051EF020|nr:augurin [Egretta garzetta]
MSPPCSRGALPGAVLLLLLLLLPLLCAAPDVSRGNKLKLMLQKREAPVATKPEVSVKETAAKEFLSSLRRQKRNRKNRKSGFMHQKVKTGGKYQEIRNKDKPRNTNIKGAQHVFRLKALSVEALGSGQRAWVPGGAGQDNPSPRGPGDPTEKKFEDDMSYWTSLGRARNEYYGGYYQHHYDEDSPIGPRNPHTFRHGAGVNYDDY